MRSAARAVDRTAGEIVPGTPAARRTSTTAGVSSRGAPGSSRTARSSGAVPSGRNRRAERVAHDAEPLQETLEVYRLEAGRWVVVGTHAGEEIVRAEPFDAVELRLARWWMPRG